jgi:hypothetical protein
MGGKILFLAPLARKRFGRTAGIAPKKLKFQILKFQIPKGFI